MFKFCHHFFLPLSRDPSCCTSYALLAPQQWKVASKLALVPYFDHDNITMVPHLKMAFLLLIPWLPWEVAAPTKALKVVATLYSGTIFPCKQFLHLANCAFDTWCPINCTWYQVQSVWHTNIYLVWCMMCSAPHKGPDTGTRHQANVPPTDITSVSYFHC